MTELAAAMLFSVSRPLVDEIRIPLMTSESHLWNAKTPAPRRPKGGKQI